MAAGISTNPLPLLSSLKPRNDRHLPRFALFTGVRFPSIRAAFPDARRLITSNMHQCFRGTSEVADIEWENLGFGPLPTDYMYVTRWCNKGEQFSGGGLLPFGNIQLNPFSSVLNYGQGVIEGLKAFRKEDGSLLLFRPEENGLRIRAGAERMCMPAPTVEEFVHAVKVTVSANRRWVPPPKKGFLHIRPLLMGSGPALSLTPSPEFIFLIYVTPVRNYFEGGVRPINLVVENETHRAVRGGAGSVKAIGNYASIMRAQAGAKAKGFDDVLYLDAVHNKYVEEVSTANLFLVKDNVIYTPALMGTILPGITRQSVIDIAHIQGFRVEEQTIAIDELLCADEVFCTGNAVGLLPVASISYKNKRILYKGGGSGSVFQQLSSIFNGILTGRAEDRMGWTMSL